MSNITETPEYVGEKVTIDEIILILSDGVNKLWCQHTTVLQCHLFMGFMDLQWDPIFLKGPFKRLAHFNTDV